jgi:hypothetical protein
VIVVILVCEQRCWLELKGREQHTEPSQLGVVAGEPHWASGWQ